MFIINTYILQTVFMKVVRLFLLLVSHSISAAVELLGEKRVVGHAVAGVPRQVGALLLQRKPFEILPGNVRNPRHEKLLP